MDKEGDSETVASPLPEPEVPMESETDYSSIRGKVSY